MVSLSHYLEPYWAVNTDTIMPLTPTQHGCSVGGLYDMKFPSGHLLSRQGRHPLGWIEEGAVWVIKQARRPNRFQ